MASAIILLPFYIKYLSTEVYGALAICLALSAFIQILTTYSFDSSLYIHYHEFKNDKPKLHSFVSASFLFMLALGGIVAVIFSVAGQLVFTLVPDFTLSFYPYGLMSVGIGIFQAIFKVHGNLLQTRENPETFLWSNVGSFAIIAITTIAGLKIFPGTLIGPLGGRLLAAILSAGWALGRVFREFGIHMQSPWKNTSGKFNAFTFIYQVQQWVINYVDRLVILFFMPVAAMATVGIYEFAVKCLAPIELLLNGLNGAVFPQVVKRISSQGEKSASPEINRYFYGQISVMMLAICGSVLVLPWLVDWFVQKSSYKEAVQYIPYIAVIFVLRSMRLYFVVPYNVLKKMERLTVLNFFISTFKIGLMILLILQWQIYGVVVSSAVTYSVEIALLWYYLKDDYKMKFNLFKLMVGPLLLFFMIILIEPQISIAYATVAHVGYSLVCAILLWFLYRNEMKLIKLSALGK
jgi:O-antigen/teichoic acid export membrane protein